MSVNNVVLYAINDVLNHFSLLNGEVLIPLFDNYYALSCAHVARLFFLYWGFNIGHHACYVGYIARDI
jgi:hypothetical protein